MAGCEAVLEVREIEKVVIFDNYEPSLQRFKAKMEARKMLCETHKIDEVNDFLPLADIIICATTSATPIFDSKFL